MAHRMEADGVRNGGVSAGSLGWMDPPVPSVSLLLSSLCCTRLYVAIN